jgi:Transposase DDE domain
LSFPGLQIVLRVDHETRTLTGERTRETRYFATSLDPGSVTPRELLALVRSHWSVENQLHFIKDRWWDEDRHYCTRPGLAERFAVLLNAVLTVLIVRQPDDDRPLRARADEMGWLLRQTLAWFTGQDL